ncbi:MAG: cytochrome c oxidase subunit I, partial [Ponticaulis sp.]|nr:cytochrome c oxidase subunit I [Ponticaulis sp.]
KMFGVRYNGFLGGLHFWLMFAGSNIVFFPQHFLGLQGMPRRYIDYNEAFHLWHYVSSIGYLVILAALFVFFAVIIESAIRRRKPVVDENGHGNPWGPYATTLEWTLPSPPPFHQFNELPRVKADDHH